MTDDLKKPAVEDFDFIRTRLEELKKEQEKANSEQAEPADTYYGISSEELNNVIYGDFSRFNLVMDAEDRVIENVPIYNPYRPFPINKQFPSIEEMYNKKNIIEELEKLTGKKWSECIYKGKPTLAMYSNFQKGYIMPDGVIIPEYMLTITDNKYELQQKKYGKDYAELLKKYRSLDCRKLLELIKIDEN